MNACTYGDEMGQEDVKPKAHQAFFNVSESKHNMQVVIAGVNREWLTTTTSSALGLWLNVDVGQEDVKLKAHQASFNVFESKHNVQVVIVGVNCESLTTTTSSALGLLLNVDVGQEDVKLKAHQASFNVSESKHNVQVVMAGVNREWLTTTRRRRRP
jgi:predicted amino acid-binding ACT domain protein